MSATARLARKEMDVLADAAQVRIVVLGHQRDAQRALVAFDELEIREVGKRRVTSTTRASESGKGWIQERHGLRLGGRLERGRASRRRSQDRSSGRTSPNEVHRHARHKSPP